MGVMDLAAFREDVGGSGPVCVRGGGTHWDVGGSDAGARSVPAPEGIEAFEPAEMTVTVGAGTTVEALSAALAEHGQEVAIDGPHGSTVGGALMVGRSPLRRGRLGEVADVLLQADCVGADGVAFTAGGPTVKNVTGYDLCRLLVGSLGTLALVGRVILRTQPSPEAFAWMAGSVGTGKVVDVLYRPATVLWDGVNTTVRVEGNSQDVDEEVDRLQMLGMETAVEPVLPTEWDRWTGALPVGGVLEVGAGVVHRPDAPEPAKVPVGVRSLGERVRDSFDPTRRLNPGRDPHRVPA